MIASRFEELTQQNIPDNMSELAYCFQSEQKKERKQALSNPQNQILRFRHLVKI